MQAVILVGGYGARLHPITLETPKPLVEVAGVPFLNHILRKLKSSGVSNVILLAGYKSEKFKDWLSTQESGLRITLKITPEKYSPIERLRAAWPLLDNCFILCYGDNFADFPNSHMRNLSTESSARLLITMKSPGNVSLEDSHVYFSANRSDSNLWVELGFSVIKKDALETHLLKPSLNESLEGLAKDGKVEYTVVESYQSVSDPVRLDRTRQYFRRRILFLDRDGILNKAAEKWNYIRLPSQLEFPTTESVNAIREAKRVGWFLSVVSNQAGIGRGLLSYRELGDVTEALLSFYRGHGVVFDSVLYCHHSWNDGCKCRKPNPGLFITTASLIQAPLFNCWVIGDQCSDVLPLTQMGGQGIHIASDEKSESCQCKLVRRNTNEAVEYILKHGKGMDLATSDN